MRLNRSSARRRLPHQIPAEGHCGAKRGISSQYCRSEACLVVRPSNRSDRLDTTASGDESVTDLVGQHVSSEILQRQLELLRLAAEEDFDHDGRLHSHGDVVCRRHDGRVRLERVEE